MNRVVLASVLAFPLGVASAAAASLGPIDGGHLGAGDTTVGRCDTAFTVAYLAPDTPPASPTNPVDRVTVSDIASTCGGGDLSLVVVDGTGAALGTGSATVPPGGVSVTVTLDQVVDGDQIAATDGARFVIVGP